jgi:large subunit ribosomal protein L12
MEYMYAAMLLHSAKKPITEEAVTAILAAAGVAADGVRVKALVAALAEVIDEALKAPVFAAAAPAAAPAEVKEEKKAAAKPKVEEKKEEDLQGLGALFG